MSRILKFHNKYMALLVLNTLVFTVNIQLNKIKLKYISLYLLLQLNNFFAGNFFKSFSFTANKPFSDKLIFGGQYTPLV